MERLTEDEPFGISVENINGGVCLHVLLHIHECRKEEFIEILIAHIVVFDSSGCLFYIYIIGWVGENEVCPLAVHELFIGRG